MGHDSLIRDVWMNNFFSAMEDIGNLIDEYNYIAMVGKKVFLFYNHPRRNRTAINSI